MVASVLEDVGFRSLLNHRIPAWPAFEQSKPACIKTDVLLV
jgi:hypothetical protein